MKQPLPTWNGSTPTIDRNMEKLLLIDGHALMFRMYYAFIRRPMINSKGEDTSVIFGFTKYLLDLIAREHPTHIAVAFDPPCKTFRHEAFPEYKANRGATPEVIKEALEPLTAIVRSMGIPVMMIPGYEADDVIGSMAKKWSDKGFMVYMVSPDKDLGQLVSDRILQLKPGKGGGDDEIVDKEKILEKFGIPDPSGIIDILAIWGDASDNVPGVKGIGEVGARKLVAAYGSIDGILEHIDEIPAKQATAIRESAETLKMSRFLVTIKTDADPGCTEDELRLDLGDTSETRNLLSRYECFSLLKLLPSPPVEDMAPERGTGSVFPKFRFTDIREFEKLAAATEDTGIIFQDMLYLSTEGHDGETVIFKTHNPEEAVQILSSGKISKTGYNLKLTINRLRSYGITLEGYLQDLELMHYLINPETTHKMEILASSYLGIDAEAFYRSVSTAGTQDGNRELPEPDLFSAPEQDQDPEDTEKHAAEATLLLPLCKAIRKEFEKDPELLKLYEGIEMPLIRVLSEMELNGFRIDTDMLAKYGNSLKAELDILEDRIRKETGEPDLNISSPIQLGNVLFGKMQLDPKARKNKRGNYSTDEETLSDLKDRHPVIGDILAFREIKKLLSTYIEPFPAMIDPSDGKVHTTFNQALTATGRLSSVRPNLQNIPIRTELGREIRKAFIPSSPDRVIISADYSQIELRVMASVCGDSHMIEAFRHGKDIHTATAARIFKVDESEVTSEQRRMAKTANFGIIYGISAFGLSQRLEISRKEAKELIDGYFLNYPSIVGYLEETKRLAREKGYVETLMGRKRYIKDINSRNAVVRGFAERNAINAPIQGTAADIIKKAMINVNRSLKEAGMETAMILQVHDELVFDAPAHEKEAVMDIVKREMETVFELKVPLVVECNYGHDWLEAH